MLDIYPMMRPLLLVAAAVLNTFSVLPLGPGALPLHAQARSSRVEPPEGARFVASSRGRVYYPVDCSAWRDLSPSNLLFFPSSEAAETRGYTPTRNRVCTGPAPRSVLDPLPSRAGDGAVPEVGETGPDGDPRRIVGICVVQRVVDGDTLRCRGGLRVRLLLIDAPEMEQYGFGLRARLALEELLPPGASAVVEVDVQERDRYGRLLAHLHTSSGLWVNRELVGRGYAVSLVYPPNVRYVELVRAAADSARTERRGLWREGAFLCPPVDFRAGRCGV